MFGGASDSCRWLNGGVRGGFGSVKVVNGWCEWWFWISEGG